MFVSLVLLLLLIKLIDCIHNDQQQQQQQQQLQQLQQLHKYAYIADTGNYTCDELIRWLGSEKHYSNNKKDILFGLLGNNDCSSIYRPVLLLDDVSFGWTGKGKRLFFQLSTSKIKNINDKIKCNQNDDYAVAYLSNFSINNNFSHFLHGLLRLFCALIDARWIVWDSSNEIFIKKQNYTIWLDEYFKLDEHKTAWLSAFDANIRHLGKDLYQKQSCITAKKLLYGSGCVKLLPPEKWFGYPGCRAKEILPAFGYYMRQKFKAIRENDLILVDYQDKNLRTSPGIRVSFAVRDVGALTGRRVISNLGEVQSLLQKTQHVHTLTENITFEHLDVPSTVRYMAGVHIFVSVHGAGMTNMFFMNPGSAVLEIIPYPLCNCRTPDYFYGIGGYYHGSSIAQGIKHYHYCVPAYDVVWHEKPTDMKKGEKCSWKHLHAVNSVSLDATRFVSLMRNIERDLIAAGTIILTAPIIYMNPNANG
jgi:hypothetical protein